MKVEIIYNEKNIVMKCFEMSHSAVGGEYEISFSEKIELDLTDIWEKLKDSEYETEEKKERSLSFVRNNTTITILKKGRILIQNLLPDTFEEAIKIGKEVICAQEPS